MRVVVQLEEHLEPRDGGFTVGVFELLVDRRSQKQRPNRIDQLAAPELVGMTRRHADHIEKRRDEPAAHQAVMRRGAVQVKGACDGHNGLEVWWTLDGGLHLRASEIADA